VSPRCPILQEPRHPFKSHNETEAEALAAEEQTQKLLHHSCALKSETVRLCEVLRVIAFFTVTVMCVSLCV